MVWWTSAGFVPESASRSEKDQKGPGPLNAPRGESQANGATENAVQRFEGIFRTMRLGLEDQMGTRIPLQHPIIHWMVEAAAELHNRWRPVRKDGRVPPTLLAFVSSSMHMGCFAELWTTHLFV